MKRSGLFLFALLAALVAGCKPTAVKTPVKLIPVAQSAISDTASIYYRNYKNYSDTDFAQLPIGIFDSGTGGLNVVEKLMTLDMHDNISGKPGSEGIPDLAGEGFQYLDDDANMPYSNYITENKQDYLRELVVKDVLFLTGNKYYANNIEEVPSGAKMPVKLIVAACNPASVYGMDDAEDMLYYGGSKVKIIGIINAGVAAALQGIPAKGDFKVGLMSNAATLESGYYQKQLADSAAKRKISLKVITHDCGNLDELIDAGSDTADVHAQACFKALMDSCIADGNSAPLKCVILGSTHYPFMMKALQEELDKLRDVRVGGRAVYREALADDFRFIDPSEFTAITCYKYLRNKGMLSLGIAKQSLTAYISVPSYQLPADDVDSTGALTYNFKYGRQTGTEEVSTKQVPFSATKLDWNAFSRLQTRIPHTYSIIIKSIQQ
jgi:glutamate racemase